MIKLVNLKTINTLIISTLTKYTLDNFRSKPFFLSFSICYLSTKASYPPTK